MNPTGSPIAYNLSVQGVPANWVNLPSSVTVTGASADVPLVLTSDSFAATGDYGFSVTATDSSGASASVQGDLVLQGRPFCPTPNRTGSWRRSPPAQATAGQGTAANFVVQLTNTGSAADTFLLAAAGLPTGSTVTFGQSSVTVPPGASNFIDVPLTVVPPLGTEPTNFPFTVTATSTSQASVSSVANGTLTVSSFGVGVTLSPSSQQPGGTFQMTVTNTGTVGDNFLLSVAAPAALAATLATNSVQLLPGTSTTVNITLGNINYALAGNLQIVATAQSQSDSSVQASASAEVTIAPSTGMTATFSPPVTVLPAPAPRRSCSFRTTSATWRTRIRRQSLAQQGRSLPP